MVAEVQMVMVGVKTTLRKQKFQEISITSQFSQYSIRKSKVLEISVFIEFLSQGNGNGNGNNNNE